MMGEDTVTETTNLLFGKQEKHTEQVKIQTHIHTFTHLQFSPVSYNMNVFSCIHWYLHLFFSELHCHVISLF